MTISAVPDRKFLASLFSKDKIVSVQLPTIISGAENIHATIHTLVITNPFQNEQAELEQLNKILSACKLQQGQYMICTQECSWSAFRKYENINSVLLFGITEEKLGITGHFAENQVIKFDNRSWVKTSSLSRLITDAATKNTLWQQALKPLFIG